MKQYRPRSWTQQAREKADGIFRQYVQAQYEPERFVELNFGHGVYRTLGSHSEAYWMYLIQMSYRHKLIKNRAAKRLGRLIREWQRKENL